MSLPPGMPQGMIQSLVNQLVTPQVPPGMQPAGPGPMPPGPPQGGPPVLPAEAIPAALPGAQAPPPGPPQGQEQGQGPPGPGDEEKAPGLTDDQADLLKSLMADPDARKQIQQIIRKVSGESKGGAKGKVDPATRLQLAQGWNARIGELALQMNAARSQNPGATKANDEALLRIYYQTPMAPWAPQDAPFPIPMADIDEYADAVRMHLVKAGWDSLDKIEDQVVRECFPLRELLIASGRSWRQRVEFVDQMVALTERWLDQYKSLPKPDTKVYLATKEGKGDPESQARDTDSSAYPPGGYRNPWS